jgi:hypothetical protein
MYKKITHTIVEEHFDHPMAVEISEGIKKTWKAPLRYYPDGQQIASGLPTSYRVGTIEQQCGNCKAFDAAKSTCLHWLQPVRADYVCDTWTAI